MSVTAEQTLTITPEPSIPGEVDNTDISLFPTLQPSAFYKKHKSGKHSSHNLHITAKVWYGLVTHT
jgi:hypothetical protein